MIKANELRTTNLVYACKGGIETRVGMIAHGTVNTFEPIPLTEEWLLKLGLSKRLGEFRKEMENERIFILHLFGGEYYYANTEAFIEIKYVHQLQNLYFALCGKELKLNNDE